MSGGLAAWGKKLMSTTEKGGMKAVTGQTPDLPKLAVVGTGRHGRSNLWPALAALPVSIPAVCSAHLDNARHWGSRLGATVFYDDFRAMLDAEALNGIVASVGPALHADLIAACLDRNLPCFVEKPAGPSAESVQLLAEHANASRVMVGFQKRHAPSYVLIHEAIQKKRWGKLESLHLEFGVGAFGKTVQDFLLEVGIHFADLVRFFAPDLKLVSVRRSAYNNGRGQVLAQFETPSGVLGHLTLSSAMDWSNGHERVLAQFERATVTVENLVDVTLTPHARTVAGVPLDKVFRHRRYREAWRPNYVTGVTGEGSLAQSGFLPELAAFVHTVIGEKKADVSSLANAAATHRLIEELARV